jgi:hypothetical protein
MWMLDAAGAVLPEGIRFFSVGWWVIHLLAVVLVFAWGYRKGRRDERREGPRPAPGAGTQEAREQRR